MENSFLDKLNIFLFYLFWNTNLNLIDAKLTENTSNHLILLLFILNLSLIKFYLLIFLLNFVNQFSFSRRYYFNEFISSFRRHCCKILIIYLTISFYFLENSLIFLFNIPYFFIFILQFNWIWPGLK
jgi:hypothetical protein